MIRIGIISPADIAFRRFMPALLENKDFEYIGLAMYSRGERFAKTEVLPEEQDRIMQNEEKKVDKFVRTYGGKIYRSYEELIQSKEIDAVYLPLPPALHYVYAEKLLNSGKHLLVEKPATISLENSRVLIQTAREKKLAICENYMFVYHRQIEAIKKMIKDKKIGDIRLLSMKFGFPKRAENDFRYKENMGGGGLFDACGYPVRLATALMGDECKVECACLNYIEDYEVDMYGSATIVNQDGITAQLAFGMDNEYRCELEIWGNRGIFRTERIFTPPADMLTEGFVIHQGSRETLEFGIDNTFANSLHFFNECIGNTEHRNQSYHEIEVQARLIQEIGEKAKRFGKGTKRVI